MSVAAKVIIGVVVLAALAGGGYAAMHTNHTTPNSTNTGSPTLTNSTSTANPSSNTAQAAATITFSDSGFSPASITVKAGDTIKITNSSNQPMQLDSDPHPTHTDEPELNVGEVDPGKSATFTLTKKGSWGYHDHLDPSLTGHINVE